MIEFRTNPQPMAPLGVQPHPSCRQIAVKRIADIISELAGNSEPITEEAFIQRGISPAVVARYGEQARQMARRSFIKQV